ncbi:MAG: DNA polymerase III subunit delta, partial [Verrucomicrobiota bacterium]
ALLSAGLPPGVSFILSGSEIDRRRSAAKTLAKVGNFTLLNVPDPSRPGWEDEVKALAEAEADRLGFHFGRGALDLFINLSGENTRQLHSELAKLALSVYPATEVSAEDVSEMVTKSRSGVIFEIGDALAARKLPKTLSLIDDQLRKGESAIGILLAAIVPRVRQLLLAKDLVETHRIPPTGKGLDAKLAKLPSSATAHLPRKKDGKISTYPLMQGMKAVKHFTVEELTSAMEACLEANKRLVTTGVEPRIILCQLVTRILQRSS